MSQIDQNLQKKKNILTFALSVFLVGGCLVALLILGKAKILDFNAYSTQLLSADANYTLEVITTPAGADPVVTKQVYRAQGKTSVFEEDGGYTEVGGQTIYRVLETESDKATEYESSGDGWAKTEYTGGALTEDKNTTLLADRGGALIGIYLDLESYTLVKEYDKHIYTAIEDKFLSQDVTIVIKQGELVLTIKVLNASSEVISTTVAKVKLGGAIVSAQVAIDDIEELEEAIVEAQAYLEGLMDELEETEYGAPDWATTIPALIDTAKQDVDNATTAKNVDNILAQLLADIADLKI